MKKKPAAAVVKVEVGQIRRTFQRYSRAGRAPVLVVVTEVGVDPMHHHRGKKLEPGSAAMVRGCYWSSMYGRLVFMPHRRIRLDRLEKWEVVTEADLREGR